MAVAVVPGEILRLATGWAVLPDVMTQTAMLGACADQWARSLVCMSDLAKISLWTRLDKC